MSAPDEQTALLRSIDSSLKALLAISKQRAQGGSTAAGGPKIASDRDLDGKYGDPVIKAKDPRDWAGPTMKGRRFSECPADYLAMLATRIDWFAQKAEDAGEKLDNGKLRAPYLRMDAARARGWEARIRAGKHTPTPVTSEAPAEWADDSQDSNW